MCWFDYVRDQGFECPSGFECFLYMLSIVDYRKRSVNDGSNFLMLNCPALDRVVMGMAKLTSTKPDFSNPESVIENYLKDIRTDYKGKIKQVQIPRELEPEAERLITELDALADKLGTESYEDTCEKLLDTIRGKKQGLSIEWKP